ncbi:MAG TPA: hypothetical protein VH583_13820 [Vicinamibacterales bacterium]
MSVACLPFLRGLSLESVFFVRDLGVFFWPRHLWIRRTLLSGHWPLWDPYAAAGQPVSGDALNQLFLPPVVLLRTLLPAVPGFNLIVALPFPLAAFGAWLFLRGRFSAAASTFGAIAFVASGAVASTANFPNLSWSVAWIPWLLWSIDRDRQQPSLRTAALTAIIIALQWLSGEPVTMVGTLGLAVAYAATADEWRRTVPRTIGAIAVGTIAAAAQLGPMMQAARLSPRGLMPADNFWSLHPLWLVEALLPHVFGNFLDSVPQRMPWIDPLNSSRDPFFYSLYMGPAVLLLSAIGAFVGTRRWRVFWLTVAGISVVLAFGDYTPIYPWLQQVVPGVRTFRFPAKFFLFTALALSMLAASAAELLVETGGRTLRSHASASKAAIAFTAATGIGLIILLSLVRVVPFTGARMFFTIGAKVGLADPVDGAAFLFRTVPPVTIRVLLVLLAAAGLTYLGWTDRREARLARMLLLALAACDLVAANANLNPVFATTELGPPAWTEALRAHPADRFYFGGKFRGTMVLEDRDVPRREWQPPSGLDPTESRAWMSSTLVMTPAAWSSRELLSYDLPLLWPVEHANAVYLFRLADRDSRQRFLDRGAVRYCVLGAPPIQGMRPVGAVNPQFDPMAVYECGPHAQRAYVVPSATIVPVLNDQLKQLFSESFDAAGTVMLEHSAPAPVGEARAAAASEATIVRDTDTDVVVQAATGADGGYLVLLDSFDASWSATVDGVQSAMFRANALYRAVRLPAGRHEVRFTYRPRVVYWSVATSLISALALAWFAWQPMRRRRY